MLSDRYPIDVSDEHSSAVRKQTGILPSACAKARASTTRESLLVPGSDIFFLPEIHIILDIERLSTSFRMTFTSLLIGL